MVWGGAVNGLDRWCWLQSLDQFQYFSVPEMQLKIHMIHAKYCQVETVRDSSTHITPLNTWSRNSDFLRIFGFLFTIYSFLPWLAKISPEHMTKIKQHDSFGNAGKAEGWRWWKQNSFCAQDMIFWTQEVTSALKSGSIAEYEKHLVGALDVDAAWLLQYTTVLYIAFVYICRTSLNKWWHVDITAVQCSGCTCVVTLHPVIPWSWCLWPEDQTELWPWQLHIQFTRYETHSGTSGSSSSSSKTLWSWCEDSLFLHTLTHNLLRTTSRAWTCVFWCFLP